MGYKGAFKHVPAIIILPGNVGNIHNIYILWALVVFCMVIGISI